MTDGVAGEVVAKPGPADLIEIFYSPRAVFERRQDGSFGLPYMALVVVGIGIYFATKNLIQPIIDAAIANGLAQAAAKQKLSPEATQQAGSMMKTFGSIGPMLFFVVAPFIVALFVWIMGKFAKVQAIGTVAVMVAVFSFYPRLLGSIVAAVLAALQPESTSMAAISTGPAHFVDPVRSPALFALLGRFDLFLLWGVVLIAIGVQAAGRGSRGQAWATAIGVWVIGTLLPLWQVLR